MRLKEENVSGFPAIDVLLSLIDRFHQEFKENITIHRMEFKVSILQ